MAELDALNKVLDSIRAAGADLVAITPQLPEHSAKVATERSLGFDLLHDEGNAVADAYGLRFEFPDDLREVYRGFGLDLPKVNGAGAGWTLPMPARYIIDTGGTIRYARVHADYTRRPEPSETVEALASVE